MVDENPSYEREIGRLDAQITSQTQRVDRLETHFFQSISNLRDSWKEDVLTLRALISDQGKKFDEYLEKQDAKLDALIHSAQKAEGQRETQVKYQATLRWAIGLIFALVGGIVAELVRVLVALHFPGFM